MATPAPAPAFLAPPDGPGVVYEFFAPFAHLPGRYEWCRIRSPTHGVFDTFIVLGESTSHPATVYVNSVLGDSFMRERYPESRTVRVAPGALRIEESANGRTVTGTLEAGDGPVRAAHMAFKAPATGLPEARPYGGTGAPVWGGRWTCWGVDLNLPATTQGRVVGADGKAEAIAGAHGIVTLGSFGRIAPR